MEPRWLPVEPLDGPPSAPPTAAEGEVRRGRARRGRPGGGPERSTQWRWYVAGALLVVLLVTLAFIDRSARPVTPDETATPTTTPTTTGTTRPPEVTQRALPTPDDATGTLYVLTEDELLTEVDLASGRSREAPLSFPVETWFVNQAVPLRGAVLVVTRRQVWSVDRATLLDQRRVGSDAWVAAAPDGSWAALVPLNAADEAVTLLDETGGQTGTLTLPPGVRVVGLTVDHLVVDAAGVIALLDRDGKPVPTPTPLVGRPFAVGTTTIARIVCTDPRTCELRAGTVAAPDATRTALSDVGGRWVFGPAGVLSSDDRLLAFVARGRSGDPVPRVVDLTTKRSIDGPEPFGQVVGPLPPVTFTPDGSSVVQSTAGGVTIWQPIDDEDVLVLADLPFEADVLAVGTSPEPPPPDQPAPAGPPPSYA